MRLIAVIYFLVAVGGMVAAWFNWQPQEQPMIALWWVSEAVLGFFALQALVAIIAAGGMKKFTRKHSLDF